MIKIIFCTLAGIISMSGWALASGNGGKYSPAIDAAAVRLVVNDAIEWQKENMPGHGRDMWNVRYGGWADGVFLSATAEWAGYDDSRDLRRWYEKIASDRYWEPGPRSLNPANDIAVSMTYARIWLDDPRPRYTLDTIGEWNLGTVLGLYGGWSPLIPTIERLDYQIKYCPVTDNLDFEVPQNQERWCWCDALYMAAPTYAAFANITGNGEYRDFMEREFWFTVEHLYDEEERLFYRDTRFIPMREANGEKVFWGRGNGWVVGAIARVLDQLPADYPARGKYEELFRQMMSRIVTLQDNEGYWHTSLLDYGTYTSPETSSTGFFTYALWWGINRGLLGGGEYLEAARRGWAAMVAAVHPGGKLGYVQPIGDAPQNITRDKNEVYGTAAFALAGLEVARYAENEGK